MPAGQAKAWFGAPPPDLSVEARVRGARLALQLPPSASTATSQTVTGWNNLVFPNVAMPHVLWELSGTNRLVTQTFDDHDEARGRRDRERRRWR